MPAPTGPDGHLPSWQEWSGTGHRTAEDTLAQAVSFAESRHLDLSVRGLLAEGAP
ncbi:hypothetical protein [Streptomyces sp. NBC_00400]|uniref:hypothetical protein n=1 Tax=Streptomyces sp. NBC_00400 TaxID=2975737 RepID=UPI002E205DA3